MKALRELGIRNGGAVPDPSTQFSLFRLYMIEHPTFYSAQDDDAGEIPVTSHQPPVTPNPQSLIPNP